MIEISELIVLLLIHDTGFINYKKALYKEFFKFIAFPVDGFEFVFIEPMPR